MRIGPQQIVFYRAKKADGANLSSKPHLHIHPMFEDLRASCPETATEENGADLRRTALRRTLRRTRTRKGNRRPGDRQTQSDKQDTSNNLRHEFPSQSHCGSLQRESPQTATFAARGTEITRIEEITKDFGAITGPRPRHSSHLPISQPSLCRRPAEPLGVRSTRPPPATPRCGLHDRRRR